MLAASSLCVQAPKQDGKTGERSAQAESAMAIGGSCFCRRRHRPASIRDKAVGAAIIPGWLDLIRNAT
jgi:hypothetical protein